MKGIISNSDILQQVILKNISEGIVNLNATAIS